MQPIDINTIKEIIETQDTREAVRVLVAQKKSPDVKIDQDLLIQLQYVRMNSLNPKELLGLLKTSVLAIYSIPEFLLSERIEDYLEQLDDIPEEISFYESFVKLLESHEEVIGGADLTIDGKKFTPSIQNLIKDYNSATNQQAVKNALTEVQYFSSSKVLSLLPENQRAVVKDIIKSYDDALEKLNEWNSIPQPQNPQEAAKLLDGFDLYKTIPGLEEDLEEESLAQSSKPKPSLELNPAQKGYQPKPQTDAIATPKPKAVQAVQAPQQEISDKRTGSNFKIPLQKNIDLRTQPKRGLVFEDTNIDVEKEKSDKIAREELERKQQESVQENIQSKLNELKKRKDK